MRATATATREQANQSPSWANLLERFYIRAGLPLPKLQVLPGEKVPQPYRRLLVHSRDMTPTLEGFYQRPMRLTVLSREREPDIYLREVILSPGSAPSPAEGGSPGRPVEYGVIRICLQHLPDAGRHRVLEEARPLGNILQTEAIPHLSWPQAFFQVAADSHMSAVLQLHEPCTLWGRRNVLLDGDRRLLAEVIEVLAPVQKTATTS